MCFLLPYSSCGGAHVFNEQFGITSSKLHSVCVDYSTPQCQGCVYELVRHMLCLTQESVCPAAATEDFPALCSGLCRVDQGRARCCVSFPPKCSSFRGPCLKSHFIPFCSNSPSRTSSQHSVPWRHENDSDHTGSLELSVFSHPQFFRLQQILSYVNNEHLKQKLPRKIEIVPRRKRVLSCAYFLSSGYRN